jgi:hypothetical protein
LGRFYLAGVLGALRPRRVGERLDDVDDQNRRAVAEAEALAKAARFEERLVALPFRLIRHVCAFQDCPRPPWADCHS